MAVQTINYLNAPRAGFEDITKGFNAAYGPTAAKRKAEANALAAEFLKLQIQHEPQKYESERAYKQSLTDAQNQKINLFSQLLGGNQASGNMSGQTQPGQFMLDPGTIEELLRVELGLGPESPEKAKQRAIDTHIQNTINTKKIEQQFPTPAVLTKDQEKIQGIEGLIPLLNKIIENPVPSQAEIPLPEFLGENTGISNIPGVSQIFNWGKSGPNENAAYHGRAGLAKDVALKSQGLSSTTENLKTIGHAIERQSGESEDAYKRRIKELVNQNIDEYEHVTGKKSNFQRYDINESPKKSSSAKPKEKQEKYTQEDLEYTAKKYGITVDQARKILEDKNA